MILRMIQTAFFQLMRILVQEWHHILEAANRTVSRSFLYVGFIMSRSVMPAELGSVKRRKSEAAGVCASMGSFGLVCSSVR